MKHLFQIFRQSHRQSSRLKGSSLLCICILAFGIALTASMFNLCRMMLFRSLPCKDADNLVLVQRYDAQHQPLQEWKIESFRALQKDKSVLRDVFCFYIYSSELTYEETSTRFITATITPGFAELLDGKPLLGRSIEECDVQPGAPRVAVISENVWHYVFGADENVIGKTIKLEGMEHTIVGVMPRTFGGPYSIGATVLVWTPLNLDTVKAETGWRDSFIVEGFVRKGISEKRANELVNNLTLRIAKELPDENKSVTGSFLFYLNQFHSDDSNSALFIALLASSLLVLLMACGIASGLMSARFSGRSQELAIRSTLGASRAHLVAEMMLEFINIALSATLLGILAHRFLEIAFLHKFYDGLPDYMRSNDKGWLIGFAITAACLVTLLSTLMPAIRASKTDTAVVFRESSRTGSSLRVTRLSNFLIITQVALAGIVLSGGAIVAYSLYKTATVHSPYYDQTKYNCVALHLNAGDFPDETKRHVTKQLLNKLWANPEVVSVGMSTEFYFTPDSGIPTNAWIEGTDYADETQVPVVSERIVSQKYFTQLGIPLLSGRDFTDEDDDRHPVAIVTDAFARRYYGTTDVLGKRFRIYENSFWLEIVGVVPDLYKSESGRENNSGIFVPYGITPWNDVILFIQTRGDFKQCTSIVSSAISDVDSRIKTMLFMPMPAWRLMSGSGNILTYMLSVFTLLAIGALVMAGAGMFGVISLSASLRKREFGIRLALGSTPFQLATLMAKRTLVCIGAGLLAGAVGTVIFRTILFNKAGTTLTDSWQIYALVCGIILLLSTVAVLIPAMLIAQRHPAFSLREQ